MSTTSSNFSTRLLSLVYKNSKEHHGNYDGWHDAMEKSLKGLFGTANNRHYMSSYLIAVPTTCDFIEVDDAISREFAKYSALKGMRFRLQLHDKMVVV